MGWFKEYKAEDPLRMVANVEEVNRVHRILNDIKGVGCRIEKPQGANGLGWRIVVDGSTDLDPIPDSNIGTDTGQIPSRPYDHRAHIGVPVGGIIIWSGVATEIPTGWALCDGTNGTPNLAGRFIMGGVRDTGATDTIHTTGIPSAGGNIYDWQQINNHVLVAIDSNYLRDESWTIDAQSRKLVTYNTDSTALAIPYYVLAFIMKL